LFRALLPGAERGRFARQLRELANGFGEWSGRFEGSYGVGLELAERRATLHLRAQCFLLREVIGNPFRSLLVEAQWLNWKGGLVAKIARTIYEEQTFNQMPVLADALEEAGCTSAELLAHCRQPVDHLWNALNLPNQWDRWKADCAGGDSGHVRGCWALDLILDKK